MNDRWSPGIGDPTVIGWLTVVAYVAAGIACIVTARRGPACPGSESRVHGLFWGGVAVMMFALGINKQLDLQSLFTQVLRDAAKSEGWYEQRRTLQASFIFAVLAAGLASGAVALRYRAMLHRSMAAAILGLIFIYGYVVVRAASFHHVDLFIQSQILGIRWNWILEIGGIVVVFVAALRAARSRPFNIF